MTSNSFFSSDDRRGQISRRLSIVLMLGMNDVVVGKQEMVSAIDAVCSVAERIISKFKEGAAAGGLPCLERRLATAPERFRQRLR